MHKERYKMRNKLNIIIKTMPMLVLILGFHIVITSEYGIAQTTPTTGTVDDKHDHPFHIEVYNGNKEAVTSFTEDQSDDASLKDSNGWNFLHVATYREHEDIADSIIETYPDLINDADNKGQTPLYIAVHKNNYNIAKLLVDHGADTTILTDEDWHAMHLAAYQGNIELTTFLIPRSLDVLHQKTSVGWSILHLALNSGNKDLISLLIQYIDINVTGRYGWTLLHLAYYIGNAELVDFLIEKGAKTDIKDNNAKIPSQVTSYYAPYTKQDNVFTSTRYQLKYFIDFHGQPSHLTAALNKPQEEIYLRETLLFNRDEIRAIKTQAPHAFANFTIYNLTTAVAYLESRFQFNKKEIKDLIIQNPDAFANFVQNQINFTMNELERSLLLSRPEAKNLIERNFSALVHTSAPQIRSIISFMKTYRNIRDIKKRLIQGPQALSDENILALRQVMPLINDHIGVDADRGTNENTSWIPLHWLLFAGEIEQILPLLQDHAAHAQHLKVGYDSVHIPLYWEFYEHYQQFVSLFKGERICTKALTASDN